MDVDGMFRASNAYCWGPERANPEIWKKIHHLAANQDRLALIATLLVILGLVSNFAGLQLPEYLQRRRLELQNIWPGLDLMVMMLFGLWFLGVLPATLAFPCGFYYFNWHQQFQALLFAGFIQGLPKASRPSAKTIFLLLQRPWIRLRMTSW